METLGTLIASAGGWIGHNMLPVLAATVAVWGVISQRCIARRKATIDLICATEADGDLIAASGEFVGLTSQPGGLAPWADADKTTSKEAASIRIVLNQFEIVAIGIQRGSLDYEIYKRWNKSNVLRQWDRAAPYIFALRARLNNHLLYHEFEQLASWLRDRHPPRRNRWIGLFF